MDYWLFGVTFYCFYFSFVLVKCQFWVLERLSGSEILKAHCDSFANFILCFIMNSCCILEKPRKMVNYHFKFIFCPKMVSSNENQRVNFIFAQSILLTKEYPLSEISDLWSHKSFEVTFPPNILLWYYSSCWDQWVAIFFKENLG